MTSIWEMKKSASEAEYEAEQAARVAVFNKVAPKGNWKGPIYAWIKETEFEECNRAAVWFTGAGLTIKSKGGAGMVLVTGPGYYATVGA